MSDMSSPFECSEPRSSNSSCPPPIHTGVFSCRLRSVYCLGVVLSLLLFSFFILCASPRFQSPFSSLRLSPVFWERPTPQSTSHLHSCDLANSSYHSLSNVPTSFPTVLRDYASWHKQQRACLLDVRCKQKPKLFVLRCPKHGYCLGLGDRMRGVLFSLFYAIATERLYIIAWPDEPYALQVALEPESIDWTPPPGFSVNRKWPYLELMYCYRTMNCNWKEPKVWRAFHIDLNRTGINTYTDDLKAIFGHHDVISASLKVAQRYPDKTVLMKDMFPSLNETEEDYQTLEKEVYRIMFKPTEKVLHKVKSVEFGGDKAYYAVHIRTGEDVNENQVQRFKFISSNLDWYVESLLDCLEIAGEKMGLKRVFLAGDSMKAKDMFVSKAKERGFKVTLFGKEVIHYLKVNHLEKPPFDDMCDRFLTVFADLYMMSRSQILVSTGSHFPDFAHILSDNTNSTHIRVRPRNRNELRKICKLFRPAA